MTESEFFDRTTNVGALLRSLQRPWSPRRFVLFRTNCLLVGSPVAIRRPEVRQAVAESFDRLVPLLYSWADCEPWARESPNSRPAYAEQLRQLPCWQYVAGEDEVRSDGGGGPSAPPGIAPDYFWLVQGLLQLRAKSDLRDAASIAIRSLNRTAGVQDAVRRLVWDLAGNPWRPYAVGRDRVTPDARRMALAAYTGRDFSSLPVLADCLEEAGCTDETLLSHLRSGQPHWRGCRALDCVLGLN